MLEVGQGAHHPLVLIDDGGFPVMNEVAVWPKLVVMEMRHPVRGDDLELAFYFWAYYGGTQSRAGKVRNGRNILLCFSSTSHTQTVR